MTQKRTITYKTKGTCSTEIRLTIADGVIQDAVFVRGCPGNTQGLARLVKGKRPQEVIALLEGVICRNGTSCPDQLAQALKTL